MFKLQEKSKFDLCSFLLQQRVFVTVWHLLSVTSVRHQVVPFGLPIVVEVVWTLVGWIGVLVAAIGMLQHIRARTVPLVRSFKTKIRLRPPPFRFVLLGVVLTMLVLEVATVKGMQHTMETGAAVTELVQQTGTVGFLSNFTAGVVPAASVAYTLWNKSFKRPAATSSNGSFAYEPTSKFNTFLTKASARGTLDFKSGHTRFDITNWGEGEIVKWKSYGNTYHLRHQFSTAHLYIRTGGSYYIQTVVCLTNGTPTFSLNAVKINAHGNPEPTTDGMFSSMDMPRPSKCIEACMNWLQIGGRQSGAAFFGLTGHRTGDTTITIVNELQRMTSSSTHEAPNTSTTTQPSNKRLKTPISKNAERANGTLGDPKGRHPESNELLFGSHKKGSDGKPQPRSAFYKVLNELQGIVDGARDNNQVQTEDLLIHLCNKYNLTVVDGSVTNATQGIFHTFFSKIKNFCPGRRPQKIANACETILTIVEMYRGSWQRTQIADQLGIKCDGSRFKLWKKAAVQAKTNLAAVDANVWKFYNDLKKERSDKFSLENYTEFINYITSPEISTARPTTAARGENMIYNLTCTYEDTIIKLNQHMNVKRLQSLIETPIVVVAAGAADYDLSANFDGATSDVLREAYDLAIPAGTNGSAKTRAKVAFSPPSLKEKQRLAQTLNKSCNSIHTWYKKHDLIYSRKRIMSMSKFLVDRLWPQNVKKMSPRTCLCPQHLQFHHFCTALKKLHMHFHKAKITSGFASSQVLTPALCQVVGCPHKTTTSERMMRHACLCEKDEAALYHKPACVNCTCQECGKVPFCAVEQTEITKGNQGLQVEVMQKSKTEYTTSTGVTKFIQTFKPAKMSMAQFEEAFNAFLTQGTNGCLPFLQHHHSARVQDNAFQVLKKYENLTKIACGVIDYSENATHKSGEEEQSGYWQHLSSALLPAVFTFRIEDLNAKYWNAYDVDKQALVQQREQAGLENVVRITFNYVSADLKHDRAFAQHCMDDIFKWIKTYTVCTGINMVSDGCAAQFKSRHAMGWCSTVRQRYGFTHFTWTYFCSAHGKCLCDPEGGAVKSCGRRYEQSNAKNHFLHSLNFFDYVKDKMSYPSLWNKSSVKVTEKTKIPVLGIFQRVFRYIPRPGLCEFDSTQEKHRFHNATLGPGCVVRSECKDYVETKNLPIRRHHCFVYGHGSCHTRKLSCFCAACKLGDFVHCTDKENVGEMMFIDKFTIDTSSPIETKFKPTDHFSLSSQGQNGDIIAYSHPSSRRGYFIGKIIKAPTEGHANTENAWDTCWTVERFQPVLKKIKNKKEGEYWMNGKLVVDKYGALMKPQPKISTHSKVQNAVKPIQILWNDRVWKKVMERRKKTNDPPIGRPWKKVPRTEANYSDNFVSQTQDPQIFFLCAGIASTVLKRMGGKPKQKSKRGKKNTSSSSSSSSNNNNNNNNSDQQHFQNDTIVQAE